MKGFFVLVLYLTLLIFFSGVHAPSAPPGTPCRGAVPGALTEPTLQAPLRQEPGPSHLSGSGPASDTLMSKGPDTIETR
ncbi:uncharacterized protein LOC102403104 isoform X2 [Bubalus bubalis]|uniref:uncharacterized protein LOC102403104 isoform X2 n=1 Tax=Bubalus bubalis TaxID=89462 RepID=UPI000DBCB3B7|nr:uncharacterized protein LOC102403104 isoform X2 [Bubalus bubalis]